METFQFSRKLYENIGTTWVIKLGLYFANYYSFASLKARFVSQPQFNLLIRSYFSKTMIRARELSILFRGALKKKPSSEPLCSWPSADHLWRKIAIISHSLARFLCPLRCDLDSESAVNPGNFATRSARSVLTLSYE